MTGEREEEIARREQELSTSPYIEEPDEREPGLMCWRDQDRLCGTDCVAFNLAQLDEHGQPIPGPEMCTLISTRMRTNEYILAVHELFRKSNRKMPYEMPEAPKL